MTEGILFAPDFLAMSIEYIGERIGHVSGYAAEEWMKGGTRLVVANTVESEVNRLGTLQAAYVQQAKGEGFDPRTIVLHEYQWTLIRKDRGRTPVASTGVVLSYTPEMDFRLGVGFIILRQRRLEENMVKCKSLLRRVKIRHNEIYEHSPPVAIQTSYLMNYTHVESTGVTLRQREVLTLLAQGLATKAIADKLKISIHTVESHRKSLLEKFGAKNVAELIMKASKMFWFE